MGDTTFGKYHLIAELGHGGMADVFLAVQAGPAGSGFRKLMVLKRLRENLAEEPEFIEMLIDEARLTARLSHPNVVQTNEVDQAGNHYYISMEYLDGQPLHRISHRVLQRRKAGLPELVTKEQAYLILVDTLAGLHYAHELTDYDGTRLHIVHRDVTPHNVFVTYDGQVKVVDFGVAKAVGRSSETREGIIKGKIRYMAPEQALGKKVDPRADVFAVGIMLWEIAAGRRMWRNMEDVQVAHALAMGQLAPPLSEVAPETPAAVARIAARALALKPEDRYPSAEEFRHDLETFLADTGALVDARRKLAPAMAELFKDKRAEIRRIIEMQLAAVNNRAAQSLATVPLPVESQSNHSMSGLGAPPSSAAPSAVPPRPPRAPRVASVTPPSMTKSSPSTAGSTAISPASTTKVPRVSLPQAPPSSTTRTLASQGSTTPPRAMVAWERYVLVGLGATLAALIGLTLARSVTSSRVETPAEAANPVRDDVLVRVNVVPPSARVTLDNGTQHEGPLELHVPRDTRTHRVLVEADGYDPRTAQILFQGDVIMSIELSRHTKSSGKNRQNADGNGAVDPAGAGGTTLPRRGATDTNPGTGRAAADAADPWGSKQ